MAHWHAFPSCARRMACRVSTLLLLWAFFADALLPSAIIPARLIGARRAMHVIPQSRLQRAAGSPLSVALSANDDREKWIPRSSKTLKRDSSVVGSNASAFDDTESKILAPRRPRSSVRLGESHVLEERSRLGDFPGTIQAASLSKSKDRWAKVSKKQRGGPGFVSLLGAGFMVVVAAAAAGASSSGIFVALAGFPMGTLSALPAAIGATFESILASPAARGLLLWKAAFAASALWYGALMARVYAQFEADASKFQDLRLQGPIAGALAVRRAAAPVALGLFPAALILRFSVAPTLGMLAGGAAAPVLGSTVWEAARTLLPFLASFLLQHVVLWRAASGSSVLAGRDVSRGLAALVTAVPFQVWRLHEVQMGVLRAAAEGLVPLAVALKVLAALVAANLGLHLLRLPWEVRQASPSPVTAQALYDALDRAQGELQELRAQNRMLRELYGAPGKAGGAGRADIEDSIDLGIERQLRLAALQDAYVTKRYGGEAARDPDAPDLPPGSEREGSQ